MARKAAIQYISFYSEGSAARQVELKPAYKQVKLPEPRRAKRKIVYVDPVAIAGIVVAVVMLVVMLAGVIQFSAAHNRQVELENYVLSLQQKNESLEETYHSGYDPEEIRSIAIARGMIPVEQAQVIYIPAEPAAQQEESKTLWTMLADLFA
jgi:hypothetical protein